MNNNAGERLRLLEAVKQEALAQLSGLSEEQLNMVFRIEDEPVVFGHRSRSFPQLQNKPPYRITDSGTCIFDRTVVPDLKLESLDCLLSRTRLSNTAAYNALFLACSFPLPDSVQALLERSVDPNVLPDGSIQGDITISRVFSADGGPAICSLPWEGWCMYCNLDWPSARQYVDQVRGTRIEHSCPVLHMVIGDLKTPDRRFGRGTATMDEERKRLEIVELLVEYGAIVSSDLWKAACDGPHHQTIQVARRMDDLPLITNPISVTIDEIKTSFRQGIEKRKVRDPVGYRAGLCEEVQAFVNSAGA